MCSIADKITWSSKVYQLKHLKHQWLINPIIIKAEAGTYNCYHEELDISVGQILILQRNDAQVVAKNKKDQVFLIPTDSNYTYEVFHKDGSSEGMYSLYEITRSFPPPVSARFDPRKNFRFKINGEKHDSKAFGIFELMASTIVYLKASAVDDLGLIHNETLIPNQFKLEFVVAHQLTGLTLEELSGELRRLARSTVQSAAEHKPTITPMSVCRTQCSVKPNATLPKPQNVYAHLKPGKEPNPEIEYCQLEPHTVQPLNAGMPDDQIGKRITTLPSDSDVNFARWLADAKFSNARPSAGGSSTIDLFNLPNIAPQPHSESRMDAKTRSGSLPPRFRQHQEVQQTGPTPFNPSRPRHHSLDIPALAVALAGPPAHRARDKIRSIEEVPEDISELDPSQIADCLILLGLEKYVDHFTDAQMNGALLKGCSKNYLIVEFGLTPVTANKVILFANEGYRPVSK